jgi:signal transduction histidine kinase
MFSLTGTNTGIDVRYSSGLMDRLDVGEVYSIAEVPGNEVFYSATGEKGLIRITLDPSTNKLSYVQVGGLTDRYSWVVVDRKERVWVLSRTRTIFRAEAASDTTFAVTRYTTADGIPAGDFGLVRYEDEIALAAPDAILRFAGDDVTGPKFVPDERFLQDELGPLQEIRALIEDERGRIWLVRSGRVDILTNDGRGGFNVETPLELSFPTWNTTQVFVDDDGVVWLSNDTRLYRYDPAVVPGKTYAADLPPVIRRITLVESGMRLNARTPATVNVAGLPEIAYNENAVRFEFTLPSYNYPAGNEYQFMLEGHDAGWSDWTSASNKSYTNLREGRYRFRVRGRNAQGMISPEAYYTFRVLPPWYRTTLAYIGYLLLAAVFIAFVIQYRRMVVVHRRAQRQAEELERERSVNERLQESYSRLQEANESLLQADKLKDEFLANTSHELRTPLTAILGFASILKDEVDGEHREFMGMIEENGKRLLHTLNSLLDLAKLRVGMMETEMKPVDVVGRAHDLSKLMMPLAKKKGIELDVRTPSSAVFALLDEHCAERILYNLVGNAIKFTDEGAVLIIVEDDGEDVLITVRDTGIGIEEQFIPQLFDEFRQESAGLTREHEGSGLGLAITNRLVLLMNGSISVESRKGVGSTFTVRFPLYRKSERHVAPSVLAETVHD